MVAEFDIFTMTDRLWPMSFSLDGQPVIPPDRTPSPDYPDGFGFSVFGGEQLSLRDFETLLYGERAQEIWQLADRVGFVRARVRDIPDFENFGFSSIENRRDLVNAMPHSDTSSFVLAAREKRSERTAIAPRDSVLEHLWDVLDAPGGVPESMIADEKRNIMSALAERSPREDAQDGDIIGKQLTRVISQASLFYYFRDTILYDVVRELSDRLRRRKQVCEIDWQPGDVVWISKIPFHYRVCRDASEISNVENPLFRFTRRGERIFL